MTESTHPTPDATATDRPEPNAAGHATSANPPHPGTAEAPAPGAGEPSVPNSTAPRTGGKGRQRMAKSEVMPVLEHLATRYPALFGAEFLPLKRGIFQDLMDAHPGAFERPALKEALALHTRSTRYLNALASGTARHNLQGEPVEPLAPEHVHHALVEVFRRRQARTQEDLRPKLRARIAQVFLASGLSAVDYADLVRSRDDAANALLDEALAQAQAQSAKNEALQRAYATSGKTVEAFAAMYGLDAKAVGRMLAR